MSIPLSVYERFPRRMPYSLGFSSYCLEFDGVLGTYVNIPNSASLDSPEVTDKVTLEAYVYPRNFILQAGIVGKWKTALSKEYLLCLDVAGHPRLYLSDDGTSTRAGVVCDIAIPLNRWSHVAAAYDGANYTYFVNGEQRNSPAYLLGIGSTPSEIQIGAYYADNNFNGFIDNPRIYDRTLSPDEIRRNMMEYHNPTRTGLVGWWRFEEGSGLAVYDGSGYGNDGVPPNGLQGGTSWRRNSMWELRAEVGL